MPYRRCRASVERRKIDRDTAHTAIAVTLMRRFAVSLLVSVVIILQLDSIPAPMLILCATLALITISVFYTGSRAVVYGCLTAILMLSISFIELSARQLRGEQVGAEHRLVVRITSVPQRDPQRVRIEAIVLRCSSCKGNLGPRRLLLSWYGSRQTLHAGETWELTARLRPMTGLRNPGGFDRVRWAIASRIHARGYVRNSPEPVRISPPAVTDIASLREELANGLAALASANEYVSLVQALTLGVRHSVAPEIRAALRDTGTAHLLAISGLHISLLAGWAYVTGRWLAGCVLYRQPATGAAVFTIDPGMVGLLLGLVVALVYALLAGFALPTQRAVIMLSVWALAAMRHRVLGASQGLSLAVVAVLVQNPPAVLSAGFWLSFGTVAALFYLHHGHQRSAPRTGEAGRKSTAGDAATPSRLLDRLSGVARMHLLLGLLLLPVTAWFFQSGSLIAPLANLLAIPWVGLIVVPLCFLTLIASVIAPAVADVLLQVTQWQLRALTDTLEWMASALAGSITLTLPSASVAGLSLCSILLLLSPRGLGLRWLGLPLLMPALVFNLARAPVDGFQVHVMDVGQGLAVLVFSGHQTLLFDTGGKVSPRLSMFEAVVVPFLHAQGRRRIDTVVISHTDEDHAFGLPDVLRRYPDARVFSSVALELSVEEAATAGAGAGAGAVRSKPCQAGDEWQDGETVFSFLHPAAADTGSDNDLSCVLLIHQGAGRVLLTGDIEAYAEKRLVDRLGGAMSASAHGGPPVLPVDVLVAPHHGSRTSSSAELLETLPPEHVVFAAGNSNRYGFPDVDVQSRYAQIGAMPYITGMEGAVSFRINRSGLGQPPQSWWHSHRRFWHGIVNPDCTERFSEQSIVLRLISIAQKGQTLCGK
ncbi:MAG: DNA internalization-related competence protein ComEC/Rec2 [Granulosicoccus sp.]|nr:DNA internalization-related competence protein ComEC/Rec2 [Granulosicoccus sp.]